jgi:hypothetical protein
VKKVSRAFVFETSIHLREYFLGSVYEQGRSCSF